LCRKIRYSGRRPGRGARGDLPWYGGAGDGHGAPAGAHPAVRNARFSDYRDGRLDMPAAAPGPWPE